MPRRRDEDAEEYLEDEEDDYEEDDDDRGGSSQKRRRSEFIDDVAIENEEEEEEEEDYEDEDIGNPRKRKLKKQASQFIDMEAAVDSEEDAEDSEEGEEGFIELGNDLGDEEEDRHVHRRPFVAEEEEQEDVDALERQIQERYSMRSIHGDFDEETTDVEQQALLPSVKDPKLWMVKCAMGREREVAVCLMQKYIDKGSELQIRSAIALDHLKNYIYVEAEKEAHVKEACRGLRNIFSTAKITIVPIKEMTEVLSVESKSIDLSKDAWVRMKIGTYKGDLAKVVDVDNVRQKVTVQLVPRLDLQAIANKLDGKDVGKKKAILPPPRLFNADEAKEMNIRVERKRILHEDYEMVGTMMFRDGFLHKTVSTKSISTQNVQPTFDELEKFQKHGDEMDGGANALRNLSTLLSNRKKGHFLKGDAVVVIRGDLKNLKGWVEKVDEENVHIRPKLSGLPATLAVNDRDLCKHFEPGDHVKVVSGAHEGATGLVLKVEDHVLIILSDATREDIRVFADDGMESSETTSGITKIGDYELHDLVLLNDMSFGVIIHVESEAFQVLKGVPERPESAKVRLREIKAKIEKKANAQDRYRNAVSPKDVVKILEGHAMGMQGPVEHIYKGMLFIYDRLYTQNSGYICAKAQACVAIGGVRRGNNRNGVDPLTSRLGDLRTSPTYAQPQPPHKPPRDYAARGRQRGGRFDSLIGTTVKIRSGSFKGYRGRVLEVKGQDVRIELESQMKHVTVNSNLITDAVSVPSSHRDTSQYSMGSETPMHPSRTPLHPFTTPMRDPGATPIHDGMRTPMRDRAWNPSAPMSPARDNWEDGNPASWGTIPHYQPGTPPARPYEAPTPGSGWANTPGGNYSDSGTPRENSYANAPSPYLPSTPGVQPMTPSSASYLPGTPGGQPMTPGNVGLDVMSPTVAGGDGEGHWLLPDILVNVRRSGEDSLIGVVKEVFSDGSCKVAIGSSGNGDTVTVLPTEVEMVVPKKSDKIKIMSGAQRGATGKLIGIDGTDGIVKVDDTLDVKILDMDILAKQAP
ncbi:putative transcription elongation factor SPT5 homolog 1 isoform X1 [Aristolochia californica]|uniref:putative transcription elongation factor SPT5 homolog 1 isoform X1 n=2 Tax=Aristolochia californica TaxID=171875 RepID=UPI0035DBD56D